MMVDPRRSIFDAVKTARGGKPFDALEVGALDNILDALNVPRVQRARGYRLHAPASFYVALRKMTGALDQAQVASIDLILAAGQHLTANHMAYVLATAWHEARFKPQAEWGKGVGRPYGKVGEYGQKQYGRGFVQLTWDANYERADRELNLDGALLKNFDLALEPGTAARILVHGMDGGWFTTRKLIDYIPAHGIVTIDQFKAARRIVNGSDKAATIANYAVICLGALHIGDWR